MALKTNVPEKLIAYSQQLLEEASAHTAERIWQDEEREREIKAKCGRFNTAANKVAALPAEFGSAEIGDKLQLHSEFVTWCSDFVLARAHEADAALESPLRFRRP